MKVFSVAIKICVLNSTSFFPFLRFSSPCASFLPLSRFAWRVCSVPVTLERGTEGVCSEIFIIVVLWGPLQHRALPPGLSFPPQPLYLPPLSSSLWPRLSPASSAQRLRFYPAPLFDCLAPRVAFLCGLGGQQVRHRCSIQQLWKQPRQKESAVTLRN